MLIRMPKRSKERAEKARRVALVTGATSSMGRQVVRELLARKYEVRAVLKTHPNETSEWRELPTGVSVYAADISLDDDATKAMLREACIGATAVFHLAAITANASKYSDMISTNVVGTENLLQAYADANPHAKSGELKFIYSSSVTVYGYKRQGETLTEDSEPMPRSAYSDSKYMAEHIIMEFAERNSCIAYTILRIGVIYGKGYERNFMRIFKLISENKLMYVGNGMNHLTLINITDVIKGMFLALESRRSANRIYNLTDGVAYTQRDLFRKAAKLLNVREPSRSVHPFIARLGARARGINVDQFSFLVSDRTVSIARIRKELGFRPSVSIDKGGKELAAEFKARGKAR